MADTLENKEYQKAASEELAQLDRKLARDSLRPYNEEFASHNKRSRGLQYEPPWYAPNPGSIRKMAERLGRLDEYDILYTHYSQVAHPLHTQMHVEIDRNELSIQPIRSVESFERTLALGKDFTLHTYFMITNEFRPGELAILREKYKGWAARLRDFPEITVTSIKQQL